MSGEARDKPVFGQLPDSKRVVRISSSSPVKGQTSALSEDLLPPELPRPLTKNEARRKLLSEARSKEKARKEWDELVIPVDPNGEIRIQGRYYQLRQGVSVLGLFSTPPGVGDSSRFYDLKEGDWVFVRRDSWESKDRRRNGWGETFVLAEDYQQGKNPKTKLFDDHGFFRHSGYAKHQGIVDRQA